jgi:hypothetical protein
VLDVKNIIGACFNLLIVNYDNTASFLIDRQFQVVWSLNYSGCKDHFAVAVLQAF